MLYRAITVIIVWKFDLQQPLKSALIITCCELESRSWRGVLDTTLCDIKIVSDLWQVSGFLLVLQFLPQIKLTATKPVE